MSLPPQTARRSPTATVEPLRTARMREAAAAEPGGETPSRRRKAEGPAALVPFPRKPVAPLTGPETLLQAVHALLPATGDDRRDLTLRQIAILLLVYERDRRPLSASSLAEELNVPRPAVSRALDRLGTLDLTRRESGPKGQQGVLVRRTRRGGALIAGLRRRVVAGPPRRVGSPPVD